MRVSDTYPCATTGSEVADAYAELRQNTIKIVPSRFVVPRGGKYIVVKDRIGILRLPLASILILIEVLAYKRFVPEQYCQTHITGGNLWYIFGHKVKWNIYSYDAEWLMRRILHWLHSKGLRYIVTTGSVGESTLRKVVDDLNRDLQYSVQIEIIKARHALRSV